MPEIKKFLKADLAVNPSNKAAASKKNTNPKSKLSPVKNEGYLPDELDLLLIDCVMLHVEGLAIGEHTHVHRMFEHDCLNKDQPKGEPAISAYEWRQVIGPRISRLVESGYLPLEREGFTNNRANNYREILRPH